MNSQITAQIKPILTVHMVISLAMVMVYADATGNPGAPRDAVVSMDGFNFRINHVVWLTNQMDHSNRYPMPSSMMPDMPDHGIRRLSINITIHNEGHKRQRFHAQEVQLSINDDQSIAASSTTSEELPLDAGQLAHLVLQFDIVPVENQKLRLIWRRGGKQHVIMTIPQPPKDQVFHDRADDHH